MFKKLSVAVAAYFCFVLTAQARTYYLPDYQMSFGDRSSQSDTSTPTHKPTCSAYGYYTADSRPSNAECTKVSIPGLSCYSCTICASSFSYNSSNCSGEYVLSGNSCGGKYNKCICDPTKYKATADGNGCAEGEIIDTSKSCTNKTDGKTLYQCVTDPCYNLADNETELGCDKYYDQCPSKCQLGTTCKPIDCSAYTLTSCPAGSACEACTPGCGNNTKRYICTPRNCSSYGYTLSSCPAGSICGSCAPGCGDNTTKYKIFNALVLQVDTYAYGEISFSLFSREKYQVDWGDGNIDAGSYRDSTNVLSHTYTKAGFYNIEVSGGIDSFSIASIGANSMKLYSLNLPQVTSLSFQKACSILTGNIPSLPDSLTNGSQMFYGCGKLTGNIPPLPDGLTNGLSMFNGCTGLTGEIPNLSSSLEIGNSMFHNCKNLTGNIPPLPNSLTQGVSMFRYCNKLTGSIPALPSELTNGYQMFADCGGLTGKVPSLPTTMTSANYMFFNCTGLSGQTPIKPSGLTSYQDIFKGTQITNDGSWPSRAW